MADQYQNKVWKENPAYIKRFYDNLDKNKKLCQEVEYILFSKIKRPILNSHI